MDCRFIKTQKSKDNSIERNDEIATTVNKVNAI